MTSPKIQALGIIQDWSATRWKAAGYVEGIGWLEARGKKPHRGHGDVAGAGGHAGDQAIRRLSR